MENTDLTEMLPQAFLARMRAQMGTEYDAFLASYSGERQYGLRYNPLKADRETFLARMPFALRAVAWAEEGFYYRAQEQPGRHPLHEAGAYYIQEPSAMAAVEILSPQPGEAVLDLCAAPGGKTTQIAGRMQGQGLLVSNEIIPNRAQILSRNVERMGVRNCIVCQETPARLAARFPGFFDRILVDAPCSGEGMFRKDPDAIAEWSEEHVRMCAARQYEILSQAAGMLRDGGVLVYSTCTFSVEENERVIDRFVKEHGDFVIEAAPHCALFSPGRADLVENAVDGLEAAVRLMPHRLAGEGHFIARLRRGGSRPAGAEQTQRAGTYITAAGQPGAQMAAAKAGVQTMAKTGVQTTTAKTGARRGPERQERAREAAERKARERVRLFLTEEMGLSSWDAILDNDRYYKVRTLGEQIYLTPAAMTDLNGLKVLRPGLHIGTERKNLIEPAHALAMALRAEDGGSVMEVAEAEAQRYLRGESLPCDPHKKGWTLITYAGYPLGFGKAVDGQMKNHYPKGLRR